MKSYLYFKKNTEKFALCIISLCAIIILTLYTDTYKESVVKGIKACAGVLVPSLFPFFFLSAFIVYTDSLKPIERAFSFAGKIFAMSKEGLGAVLLSVIGGYPVGARTISSLYREKRITYEEAKRLCYCCVGSGPGFLITFIGEGIFLSKKLGFLLLISNISAVFVLLLISKIIIFFKRNINHIEEKVIIPKTATKNFGDALISATESAVTATLSMCGIVVIFITIGSLLEKGKICNEYFLTSLEITSGMINYGYGMSAEAIGFFTGFGGLCVHFQIYSIAKNIEINKVSFTLARIFQGGISAAVLHILLIYFPVVRETFSNLSAVPRGEISTTLWGGGAIILLSIVFIIIFQKQEVNLCAE